ncbi:hypothetical protein FRC00_012491, partial [Tulasnella sp. 408]
GPSGPKTLCNACGLRFSKKVKTKASDPSPNSKEDQPKADGPDGDDGLGDEDADAGDLGTDNAGIIDGGGISQSPIMHTHHELDFSGTRMGYDIPGMHPAPPPNKLAAAHPLAARHSLPSGLQQSLPPPFASNHHGTDGFMPVSMTMSMPSHLSTWFAGGGRSSVASYDHPGYSPVGDAENLIRAPQPKQALQPLQTHFGYSPVMAGGPPSSVSSAGHPIASSGPMYHHYQPSGGPA